MTTNWHEDGSTLLLAPKAALSASSWRHHHVLDLDDFTPDEIELILHITDSMKEVLARPVKKVPALRGKTVLTLFYENSTRTRLSFELAAKNLSADVSNLASGASSVTKGESMVDTFLTLESLGADVIVMRHPHDGAAIAWLYRHGEVVEREDDERHAHLEVRLSDADLGRVRGTFQPLQ